MMRITAPLVCISVCCPAVHAAENERKTAVSIYCMAYAGGLKSVFVKSAEDSYQAVNLSTANVVEAGHALVEKGFILFYGPAGTDGKHPVAASVEITGIRQPLIVLHPAGEGSAHPYESKAVEAESAEFPLGSFHLVNLSPHPVRITHDEKVIELQNGVARVFMPDHSAGDSLAMTMDYKNGDNWQLLSSARWPSRNDRRSLVCFQLDPGSKRMNVKSIPLRQIRSR